MEGRTSLSFSPITGFAAHFDRVRAAETGGSRQADLPTQGGGKPPVLLGYVD